MLVGGDAERHQCRRLALGYREMVRCRRERGIAAPPTLARASEVGGKGFKGIASRRRRRAALVPARALLVGGDAERHRCQRLVLGYREMVRCRRERDIVAPPTLARASEAGGKGFEGIASRLGLGLGRRRATLEPGKCTRIRGDVVPPAHAWYCCVSGAAMWEWRPSGPFGALGEAWVSRRGLVFGPPSG